MPRRRPIGRRIADWWAELPWIVREGICIAVLIFVVVACPGCTGSVKPWADIDLKDDAERATDHRWGAIERVWIGITWSF